MFRFLSQWVLFFSLFISAAGWGSYSLSLSQLNQEPSYCQEYSNWCGAASAQMILEAYPYGEKHKLSQATLWSTIQKNMNDPNGAWASDPDGLRTALEIHGKNLRSNWQIFNSTKAQTLLYSLISSLRSTQYPATVLVYGFQHWIVVDGFKTNVDPARNNDVRFEQIEITNPWPPCSATNRAGVRSLMTGENWFKEYWYSVGGADGSKWAGNFVGIFQKTDRFGTAYAQEDIRDESKAILPAKTAQKNALRALKKLGLAQKPNYSALLKAQAAAPLLVHDTHHDNSDYYVVPLVSKNSQKAVGSILINAHTGEFQEIGVLGEALEYLSKEKAIQKFAMQDDGSFPLDANTETGLVFQPSEQTRSRFYPIWYFKNQRQTKYMTQTGERFSDFTE